MDSVRQVPEMRKDSLTGCVKCLVEILYTFPCTCSFIIMVAAHEVEQPYAWMAAYLVQRPV